MKVTRPDRHRSRDALAAAVTRAVTPEELRQALESPIPADEREEILAVVRWFTTRYATPEDRLSYVRRAFTRWRALEGSAGGGA
jgi:hypothetical protein